MWAAVGLQSLPGLVALYGLVLRQATATAVDAIGALPRIRVGELSAYERVCQTLSHHLTQHLRDMLNARARSTSTKDNTRETAATVLALSRTHVLRLWARHLATFTQQLEAGFSELSALLLQEQEQQERRERREREGPAGSGDGQKEQEQQRRQRDQERLQEQVLGERLQASVRRCEALLVKVHPSEDSPSLIFEVLGAMMHAVLGVADSGSGDDGGSSSTSSEGGGNGSGDSSSTAQQEPAPTASTAAAPPPPAAAPPASPASPAAAGVAFYQELVDSGVLEWAARCLLATSAALAPYRPYTQTDIKYNLLAAAPNPRAQLVVTSSAVEYVVRHWVGMLGRGLTLATQPVWAAGQGATGRARSRAAAAAAIRQPLARALAAGHCPCLSHLLATYLVGLCVALDGGPDYGLPGLTAAWRAVEAGAAADHGKRVGSTVSERSKDEQTAFVLKQQRAGDAALAGAAAAAACAAAAAAAVAGDGSGSASGSGFGPGSGPGPGCRGWLAAAAAQLSNENGGPLGQLRTGEERYCGYLTARSDVLHGPLELWAEALAAAPGLLLDGGSGQGDSGSGGGRAEATGAVPPGTSGGTGGRGSGSIRGCGKSCGGGCSSVLRSRVRAALVERRQELQRLRSRQPQLQAPGDDAATVAEKQCAQAVRRLGALATACGATPPLNTAAMAAVCVRLLLLATDARSDSSVGIESIASWEGLVDAATKHATSLVAALHARHRLWDGVASDSAAVGAGAGIDDAAKSGPRSGSTEAASGSGATSAQPGAGALAGAGAAAEDEAAEEAAAGTGRAVGRPKLAPDQTAHLARATLLCSKAALLDLTSGAVATGAEAVAASGAAIGAASATAAAARAAVGPLDAAAAGLDVRAAAAAAMAAAGARGGPEVERLWRLWWGAALGWVQLLSAPAGPNDPGVVTIREVSEVARARALRCQWQWQQVAEVLALALPPTEGRAPTGAEQEPAAVPAAAVAAAAAAMPTAAEAVAKLDHDALADAAMTWPALYAEGGCHGRPGARACVLTGGLLVVGGWSVLVAVMALDA